MSSLLQAIPSTEVIEDEEQRRIFGAIRANLLAGGGLTGPRTTSWATEGLLKDVGLIGYDKNGNPYRLPEEATVSSFSNFVPSLIADGGWLVDKINCAGLSATDFFFSALSIPQNAVITDVWYDVLVPFTASAGAPEVEVVLQYETPALYFDLVTSSVLGAGFTAGFHDGVQDGTAANMGNKLDSYYSIRININGTGTISAGIFNLFVNYKVSS